MEKEEQKKNNFNSGKFMIAQRQNFEIPDLTSSPQKKEKNNENSNNTIRHPGNNDQNHKNNKKKQVWLILIRFKKI